MTASASHHPDHTLHDMGADETLFLHEEILLLALRDGEGAPDVATWYQQAIGGAILAELLLAGRIEVRGTRSELVQSRSDGRMGDVVLDVCLDRIRTEERPRSAQAWVERFAELDNLKDRVARKLCRRGILEARESGWLFFKHTVHREIDPGPERDVFRRLRHAIFRTTGDVDARTSVLVCLADATGILDFVFGKKKLAEQRSRIAEIKRADATRSVVDGALSAAQAAESDLVLAVLVLFALFTLPSITASPS